MRNHSKFTKIFLMLTAVAMVVCFIMFSTFKVLFSTEPSENKKSSKPIETIRQSSGEKNDLDALSGKTFLSEKNYLNLDLDVKKIHKKIDDMKILLEEKSKPSLITKPFDCVDKDGSSEIIQHGPYWQLRNYVKASINVKCHESITYTTHCVYNYLHNVIPLLESWQAPLSVALWAPGVFFNLTLEAIAFYRKCHPKSNLVQRFATFHIFFEADQMPKAIPQDFESYFQSYVCPVDGSLGNVTQERYNLTYPINVARNIARSSARTHYVFVSDIELYPSQGIVDAFFKMLEKSPELKHNKKQVFVFPVFEVEKGLQVPRNKTALMKLYQQKLAVNFQYKVCISCHGIPKPKEWIKSDDGPEMRIFASTKRQGEFKSWEPFYIGTNFDPIFDERLNWEGGANKMTQSYIMCLLDYDFHLVSNYFLVHKPGIKENGNEYHEGYRVKFIRRTNKIIRDRIYPEYDVLYGTRKGCIVNY